MSAGNPGSGLFLGATRETGEDTRNGNVLATTALSNIIRTSLGPQGTCDTRATTQYCPVVPIKFQQQQQQQQQEESVVALCLFAPSL